MKRDKRGRRIGFNAWRNLITDAWRCADHADWLAMEAATSLYATEVAEWRAAHPRPNLGDFMRELAPMWTGARGREHAAAA